MTFAPFFHVGILVEDIDAAAERFHETLGLTFRPAVTARLERFADPEPRLLEPRFTYSFEGPPYLELVQMTDSALHAPALGEGLHHLGIWLPDSRRGIADLERRGLRREASIQRPDGTAQVWFNDPADLHGTRVEFLDEEGRTGWEAQYGAGAG